MMTNHDELRRLAEAALRKHARAMQAYEAQEEFRMESNPAKIIALLDEIAQLRAQINEATDIAISNNNARMEEIAQLRNLLGRGHGKLIIFGV